MRLGLGLDLGSASGALDQAILDYEAHVGEFMTTGAEITTLRDRANAYVGSSDPTVAAKAKAVVDEANSALSNFNDIQSTAIAAAQKANALQTQLKGDANFQNNLTADTSSLGWATLQAFANQATSIAAVAGDLASVESRLEDHLNNTMPSLRSDEQDLENFAQGKGIAGASHGALQSLTSVISGSVSGLSSSLGLSNIGVWLGVGLAVTLFGPMLLEGVMGALVPRPRTYRNPRRRRRLRRRLRRTMRSHH